MTTNRPPHLTAKRFRGDIALILILGVAAALSTSHNAGRISPLVFGTRYLDLWFDADTTDYVRMMISLQGPQSETKVHPLLSLMIYPPVKIFRMVFGLAQIQAIRLMLALVAAVWAGEMFVVLRLMGCRRPDAALFTLLGMASAASVFWFTVPETGALGSLTILAALGVMALSQYRKVSPIWYAATSALTLSATVTNWMAGIFLTIANFPWRRASQLTGIAFCMVLVLSCVQKAIFPSAHFFWENPQKGRFIFNQRAGGPQKILPSFVFHTMVMPAIQNVPKEGSALRLRTQSSPPGSASMWGRVAVWLWAGLLGMGVGWTLSSGRRSRLIQFVWLTLLGQLLVHLVFGIETFLQSLHFLPLLIVIAAFGALTRFRPLALIAASALAVCAFMNNQLVFEQATAQIDRFEQEAHAILP